MDMTTYSGHLTLCPFEDEKVAKGFAHGCGGKATVITVESKTAADISQADGSCKVCVLLFFVFILWFGVFGC